MIEEGRGTRWCWHSTTQWDTVPGFGRGLFVVVVFGKVRYGAGVLGMILLRRIEGVCLGNCVMVW